MRILNKIAVICILLVLFFSSGISPILFSIVYAESENYKYTLDSNQNAIITAYSGMENNLIIPEELDGKKVIEIGDNAFKGNSSLKSVEFPSSVKKIGNSAFKNCKNLKNVTLSEGLIELKPFSFGNTAIESITIPKSLIKSEYNVDSGWNGYGGPFTDCAKLKVVSFAEGRTEIPIGLFAGVTGLESITIPDSITTINDNAFLKCTNLANIKLGKGVTELKAGAFSNCTSLKSVEIPSNIQIIGNSAFKNCSNLQNVILTEGLTELKPFSFGNTAIESITIPKSLIKSEYNVDSGWNGYGGPFTDCAKLKVVNFAEGRTEIPTGLFAGVTGLESITIPNSITTINDNAFLKCTNLTNINLGKGVNELKAGVFSNCTSLKRVEIPSNVQIIGNSAFKNCSNLQNVILTEGLTELKAFSFGNTAIESITIPKSLSKSEYNVDSGWNGYGGPFTNCAKLKVVNFAEGRTEIPEGLFQGVTGLEQITIPNGIRVINNKAFSRCTNLTNIKLDKDLTDINAEAFSNCISLKNVEIPSSVKTIKERAFQKCTNLESVYFPKDITECATDAFKETNATMFCDKYSKGMKLLINQEFEKIEIVNEMYNDSIEKAILKEESEYLFNMDSSGINYIPVKLKYSIKHNLFDKISEKRIKIKLPKNVELYNPEIYVDSKGVTNYDLDAKKMILTVPVENQTGMITFNIKAIESVKIQSYAELLYKKDKTQYADLIEVVIENKPVLTITAQEETNNNTVEVTGVGPKGKNITIMVDGQQDINVKTSDTTGRYNAQVNVNNSTKYYETDIKAKTQNEAGDEVYAITTVKYNDNAPNIKSFIMNYKSHINKQINLLEYQKERKTLTFAPGIAPSFELEFDNSDKIDKLYVTSTRNGVKKYLEAKYDSNTKKYYASGYFDKNNGQYVPGILSYEYILKKDESISQKDLKPEDTVIYKAVENAKDNKFKIEKINTSEQDAKVTTFLDKTNIKYNKLTTEAYNLKYVTDSLAQISSTQEFKTAKFIKTEIELIPEFKPDMETLGDELEGLSTASKVAKYFTKDGKLSFNVDMSDPYSVTSFVYDVASNKVITYTIGAGSDEVTAPFAQMCSDINKISPLFKIAKNYYGLDNKRDELTRKILESDMTDEEKEVALECAGRLDTVRRIDFVFASVFTLFGMEDKTTWGIINACHDFIFEGMYTISEGSILGEYSWIPEGIAAGIVGAARIIPGGEYIIRWIIDPSGYVYEATPTNRLEGVKCTVYYKEKENSTPVLWNATEYEQENPLYTDEDGKYAWDVPEGLWQVKYEKEGYETKYSEWLPVPPPQTDINIALVSKQKPKVTNTNIYNSYIEIEFDKYMDINTLNSNAISVKDKNNQNIEFAIEFVNKTLDENGKYLASKILLKPKTSLEINNKYKITINSKAKSYAGIAMEQYVNEVNAQKEPNIVCDENISMEYGKEKQINIKIENLDKGVLNVNSSDSSITVSEDSVNINNGVATISLNAIAKGSSIITLQIENTNIYKNIYVTCESNNQSKIFLQEKNINIAVGSTYKINPILYPITQEHKFIYKSYNMDIAKINENGEINGVKEGSANIVIQTVDGNTYEDINVNVIKQDTTEYLKGDVNGDGKVSLLDYGLVLAHVKRTKLLTGEQLQRADVNGDNKVSLLDYGLILAHVKRTKLLF